MDLTRVLPRNPLETLVSQGFLFARLPKAIQESIRATFDAGFTFFREPVETKVKFGFEQDLGYRAFGDEYSVSPDYPDQLESFSVSPRLLVPKVSVRLISARVLYERMSATFDLIEPIVEGLTTLLANEISGRSLDHPLSGKLRYWSRLQLNYTRPANVDLPFINETHEDLDLFTLTTASAAGLEVKRAEDHFIPVDTSLAEAIIFPGEIAWLLSGGKLKPQYHRVRTYPKISERISMLFFADPEPTSCQPWILSNTNRGIDIPARVRRNVSRFGLKGFTDELNG